MTYSPAACAIWPVSMPSRPRPYSTTVSPKVQWVWRSASSATAPRVTKEASATDTPAGMRATRLRGTATTSAWCEHWLPEQATRSPTARSVMPSPTSITSPARL